ncbi:MAG: glycoside hydrolase family 3 C-terminal domain-containing protein [Oscillospiraceae bacterium]|nr:glycoside hydrolase family 3 C-terminal domain-containing protein [Oscillospiraceae bacterium]
MKKLKKQMGKMIQRIIDSAMGNGLMQEETTASGERYVTPGMPELLRRAGAESCVLLRNDGALPLAAGAEIALFGRCQLDWFYVGYGSGGDVNAPYQVNLVDGMLGAGVKLNEEVLNTYRTWTSNEDNEADHGWWGHWPMNYPEMPLTDALVKKAAETSETAVVVIGRAAGEDRENTLTKGSYYLTDDERSMLDAVTSAFGRVVVLLNIGNIMDMSWTEEYGDKLSAFMIVWQGGMESGNAIADVLTGKISPCGKLSDTVARRYEDYPSSANFGGKEFNEYAEGIYVGYRYFDRHPEKVLYPFGYGLSYTEFETTPESLERAGKVTEVTVTVKNTGKVPGKETVQLWAAQPDGRLDKPVRVLAGFTKTGEILPGMSETVTIRCIDRDISSYDEASSRFILEPGEYRFETNGKDAGSFAVDEEKTVEQCEPLLREPQKLRRRILERLPSEIGSEGKSVNSFREVTDGNATLDRFIASLTDEELEALSRGHGMMGSSYGVAGNAGAFGGITESLEKKGVPAVITSDGPAGLRLRKYCSLLPCGTALACTWNTELVEALSAKVGEEMVYYGVDVQLAPGMNIHRNPLCGRNFEYFSEDPLLSGRMAAGIVRGVQNKGKAACPKHFACNNQETKRNTNDSRVSERALREIYLRNFEIVVKEAEPLCLMTSYNKINGVWSHYNYDLVTTVLRKEWGYTGCVITDWWMRKSKSPEFPNIRDNAYRVRAQVDVLMPGDMGHLTKKYRSDGTLLETLGKPDGITRGELQRTAKNVLNLIIRLDQQR